MRLDLDKTERFDRSPRLHERVRPLALSSQVVADDSLFQSSLIQVGERHVREPIPEDRLVAFEERLPHAFCASSDLALLMLEVVSVEQQLLVLAELLPSITERNEIRGRDLGTGQLKDEFLVLDQDVADLIWRQEEPFQFAVCDIDTLVTGELNQAEVRDEFKQPRNLFADEREVGLVGNSGVRGEALQC